MQNPPRRISSSNDKAEVAGSASSSGIGFAFAAAPSFPSHAIAQAKEIQIRAGGRFMVFRPWVSVDEVGKFSDQPKKILFRWR
jgi:hypothetical protein